MAKEDLISISSRTTEEQQEICSKGGKASGAARRRKRTMKSAAQLILSMQVKDLDTINALKNAGVDDPEGMSNLEAMVAVAVAKAKAGDLRALAFIRDTIGENPELMAFRERTEAIKNSNDKHSAIVDAWVQAVIEADTNE